MNINTLIESIVSSLAADTALVSWSQVTYGKRHNVFINIDLRNPPTDATCPYIILLPIRKTVGAAVDVKSHAVEVDCCIHDDKSQFHEETNITEFKGTARIEEFRKLAETAVMNTDIGNLLIETIDIEYDVIESFPFMWSGMTIEISEHFVLGSDPLE